ncbi:hypothetical protein F8388_001498 [Cannabis sativa]|uniref:CCHC-type domain-containing protein n=1 Tax=Cannabis sativa TaxID=3483 RepID=A0A7J6EM26_CANSA|nr:hypothetical protein F8388_001498 [Cannabis sativa]KAF4383747.1 hypothetical protein G4B88_020069 [Cannabis sativa]
MCVIKYGGQWKEDKKYEDYIMTGLLIPTNCDLKSLLELVKAEIKCNTTIEMHYQLCPDSQPMKIISDNSLMFYLQLRKTQNAVSESPLCITTVDDTRLQIIAQQKPESESVRQDTDVQKLVLQITNQPTYDYMEYDDETSEINEVLALPNIFQVADSVADCIIEKTQEHKRKRQEEERQIITDHKSMERIVWPPKSRKPAGRPRKKRIRSKGEPKVVLKCTRCGKVGHNRRTCNNPQLYKPPKQNNNSNESKKNE